MMYITADLLRWEAAEINRWLTCFSGNKLYPQAGLGEHGGTLWVVDFPLPDKYAPEDRLDLLFDIHEYPDNSPRGIFLKESSTNQTLLSHLQSKFNVFAGGVSFHNAPKPPPGWLWVCYGHLDGWRYNIQHPNRGDNMLKLLQSFWRVLEE
ncbi:hypothetical protein AGMMS50256_17430 [Betaproteobacteria bacterium]|nr:hypothetical protein AGMMS50256_17430 [Betaproteobacteria bacterium]